METRKFMLTVVSGDTINDAWLSDQLDGFVEALTDAHGNMAVGFDPISETITITPPPVTKRWDREYEKYLSPYRYQDMPVMCSTDVSIAGQTIHGDGEGGIQ